MAEWGHSSDRSAFGRSTETVCKFLFRNPRQAVATLRTLVGQVVGGEHGLQQSEEAEGMRFTVLGEGKEECSGEIYWGCSRLLLLASCETLFGHTRARASRTLRWITSCSRRLPCCVIKHTDISPSRPATFSVQLRTQPAPLAPAVWT